MSSNAVVVSIEPVGGFGCDGFDIRPRSGVDEFFFIAGEGTFGDGIVVADSGTPQGTPDMVFGAVIREFARRILRPAIAVDRSRFSGHRCQAALTESGDAVWVPHVVASRTSTRPRQ